MSKFYTFIERYKFGIIAAFATYVIIFMYLQMETYTKYYPIEPFFEEPTLIIPEDEVEIKPENIEIPADYKPGDVKSISRDLNDNRKRSDVKWDQNKSASEVEQSVKDYEKKLFEESGGSAERKRIQQEMEQRNKQKTTATSKQKETTTQSGGNTAYSGNVMVDWSLSGRNPHQNNNWYVRNPGYTCGHGSSGRVSVTIQVNQNGDVISAVPTSTSGANACMIEQAVKYAKLSRFNYSGSSPKAQQGTITYTFVSQ